MLEVRDVDVDYGAALAVAGASLDVAAGELVCVVGPNGAGKSTLVNAIAGLNRARRGTIAMEGRDLTALPAHRYCEAGIAIVPEGRRLFTRMSVRENLELGGYALAARRERARTLDRVCTLFPAVRDKLDAPAGALSGGQQQMVAIGRALMAQPRLLLLDEPSLGLSPLMVQAMFGAIEALHDEGMSILLVEQNVASALAIADRAYLLEEGRIVAGGTPQTVFRDPALRRAYLGAASGA
ncbi:MAG: ABC transporter ATP-binding protein [Burkholderiales bacterium]